MKRLSNLPAVGATRSREFRTIRLVCSLPTTTFGDVRLLPLVLRTIRLPFMDLVHTCRDSRNVPFNDLATLEMEFEKDGDKIAAFMVEPVQGEAGVVVPDEWIHVQGEGTL